MRSSRNATLLAFSAGHFSHHLCTAAAIPLLPMIRDSLQLDYLRSGLLLSAFAISYGLVQLPMAAISDRFSKRLVVAVGLLGTGGACMAVSVSRDYTHLLLALLLMGVAGSTYHAPASAFISQVFSKEARGQALGWHLMGGTSGLMAAPVIAIFLASSLGGWRMAFLSMGLPALLAGISLLVISKDQERAVQQRVAAAVKQREPMGIPDLVRALGAVVLVGVLSQLLAAGMNSFLPIYLVDKHGASQSVAGLMMTVVYGAGVVGGPIAGRLSDRWGRKPMIFTSVVGMGPAILMVTLLPFGPWMVAAIALYGLFQIFRLPSMESLIADVVPSRQRATAMGGYNLLAQETSGLATPLFGWMMDQYGINTGFDIVAGVALAVSLGVLILRRRI